jgi:replicative DNA helicase
MDDIKFESATLERVILSYLIKDRSFFLKIAQYLKTNDERKKTYFIDAKLQWLLNFCCKYYDAYDRIPSLETVKIAIETATQTGKFDALLSKAMRICAEEIYSKNLEDIEADYIKDETIKFVKTMKAYEATTLNQIDIANGKFDSLSDRMQKALNINLDKDLGISLSNIGETLELIQQVEADSGLTFGSPALDRVLGSPKPGELTVFCGTPGIGKTIWLGNIATENMKLGKKGVFFSLEVDKRRLAKRLYSSLLYKSGIDLMNTSKEEAEATFADYGEGDIKIKNYPAHNASCNTFANYLMDLYTITGFKPDYIVIDYILITAANNMTSNENMYSYYKIVAEEMRNLAVQFNCPVFTAAQINRNGMGEKGGTKGLVTSKDLAESRGILDTADYLLIINQNEMEKNKGKDDGISEQRIFVDKNRNGSNGEILNFTLNYNTMTITDGKKEMRR